MKRLITTKMFMMFMLLASSSIAQRLVPITASADLANPTDIFPIIMGDTTSTGDRVDENTIYQLDNGGCYITTGRLVNKANWALQIEAVDLENTKTKPVISRIPNDEGKYPDIMRAEGNVRLQNIWIVQGEKGPLEDHDWGKVRVYGENTRFTMKNCIVEKDRGGFVQLRANGVKIYIESCVFRNGGNRRILQGNGRVIDGRNYQIDSLVVKNSVFHNLQDRIFRSSGATEAHNYIEFDHNTVFNQYGRHGCFQFAMVNKVVVTNNVFANPIMLGTTPEFANEQSQVDNTSHKIFTINGEDVATDFTFSNNNIFWTDDVLAYYASNDTVSQVGIYSQEILKKIGGESAAQETYFTEVLTLNEVPGSVLQLVKDTYTDPTATDMFDIIVEDISRQGTDFDGGNLFDFSNFDPNFDPNSTSATAATDGKAIGARYRLYGEGGGSLVLKAKTIRKGIMVYPNPSRNIVNFVSQDEPIRSVEIFSLGGKRVELLENRVGQAQVTWENSSNHKGIYYYKIHSSTQILSSGKLVLQ